MIQGGACVDVVLLRDGVLLPVKIFDAVKRRLSGVYGNLSVPVIRIIIGEKGLSIPAPFR